MKSIAAAIIVVASAWLWQTTVALFLLPDNKTGAMAVIGFLMVLIAFITGIGGFLNRPPDRRSWEDPSFPPFPEQNLPPRTFDSPDPEDETGKS